LRDSHILPEFVYRPTYDATHTAILYEPDVNRKGRRQKGFTERLLCDECEKLVGTWETYFADVWLHPTRQLRPAALPNDQAIVADLDYARFKLFHLSLIWRSGVSTRQAFGSVRLGGQEPKLRKRLLASDPGDPADYPFFGIALRDLSSRGFQDKLLMTPRVARVHGHWVYILLFGGVLWHYYISSHAGPRNVPVLFDRTGTLTLLVQNWKENPFILELARQIQSK
jgi:hypothetical protein